MQNIKEEHIPVRQSFFAGMYVCNTVLYQTIGYVEEQDHDCLVGFMHVPLLDSQDPDGMALDVMINAVTIAIQSFF